MRQAAVAKLPTALTLSEREAARRAIDAAMYGVMQVCDGVTGALGSQDATVELSVTGRLRHGGEIVQEMDLRDGDSMCMGFHGWLEGDLVA